MNRMKMYRCKSGHEYSDIAPWELRLKYAADAVVSSGPLCPYCYQDFLRESFSAEETEEPVKATTVVFWPSGPENPKPKRAKRKKETRRDET